MLFNKIKISEMNGAGCALVQRKCCINIAEKKSDCLWATHLRKKLSPGDICTQSGGLTHKNQLFLVIDVKEKAETALVVPVTTDYNPGSRIILINHEKYRARVVFPMELPLITLTVVPELQLNNLQETLTKLQRNLHLEEKNNLIQTTSASNKTLPSGTICILNKKCKDKRLLAINARYFLILESDGKTVNAVPLYYNTKSKNLAIKINGVAFCALANSSVSIPLNSISVIEKMKLDEPEKIIEKVKRNQCNPPKKRGKNRHRPILEQDEMIPFPYLPIQPGDICKAKADSSLGPKTYYLIIDYRSEKEVIVVPIRKTNAGEKVSEKIIISNETFWIDVLARQDFPIASLTAVSHNHGEVVKRVIRRKIPHRKVEDARKRMGNYSHSALKADAKERIPSKKEAAQQQRPPLKKETVQWEAPLLKKETYQKQDTPTRMETQKKKLADLTANKTLYIYKGRIVCHHQEHPIIPAAATFFSGNGKEVKIDVEYCQKCERLMMNYTSFCLYRERFGVLIRNLRMISSEKFNGELTLAQESPLRLCGYTVSQAEGLTESERHYILAKMIHDNIMPKTEVIRYLEHFINMNGAKYGNELALSKWESDLKFVHNYRIDTQPEVYITKVEKY